MRQLEPERQRVQQGGVSVVARCEAPEQSHHVFRAEGGIVQPEHAMVGNLGSLEIM